MKNEKYNGWRNYETWVTALWLDNDQASQEYWRAETQSVYDAAHEATQVRQAIWTVEQARRIQLADRLKDVIEQESPVMGASLYADLMGAAIAEIDFQEIAEHYLDELEQERPEQNSEDSENPVIHSYTRTEALADGVLKDVTATAQEAGIKHPTALTAAVWAQCVTVPPEVSWNDEAGRLWDVLSVLRQAITADCHSNRVEFQVTVQTSELHRETRDLYALCHPADDGRTPVITVMMQGED